MCRLPESRFGLCLLIMDFLFILQVAIACWSRAAAPPSASSATTPCLSSSSPLSVRLVLPKRLCRQKESERERERARARESESARERDSIRANHWELHGCLRHKCTINTGQDASTRSHIHTDAHTHTHTHTNTHTRLPGLRTM